MTFEDEKSNNDKQANGDAGSYENAEQIKTSDWLFQLIALPQKKIDQLKEEVKQLVEVCEKEKIREGNKNIAYFASSKLIRQCAVKVGLVGGVTAAPATIPVIGTIGTAVAGTTIDLVYQIRMQIEMCYKIAFVHDSTLDDEELKAIILALIGFASSTEMMKNITGTAFKSVVDEISKKYLTLGIEKSCGELAAKFGLRIFGKAYKLIPFVSIPLSASINISSTMLVGNHARRYFQSIDVI